MEKPSQKEGQSITGVILAGGRGSRMGGQDKGLVSYKGKPLFQHVLMRLQPQVDEVFISANRNISRYQQSGLRVVPDSLPDYPGPLAGMLSVLDTLESRWVVFASCDTPNVPSNLVSHLWDHKGDASIVWASTEERDHPTLALLHSDVKHALQDYLLSGERRVMQFMRESGGHAVLFENAGDAFININFLPK